MLAWTSTCTESHGLLYVTVLACRRKSGAVTSRPGAYCGQFDITDRRAIGALACSVPTELHKPFRCLSSSKDIDR